MYLHDPIGIHICGSRRWESSLWLPAAVANSSHVVKASHPRISRSAKCQPAKFDSLLLWIAQRPPTTTISTNSKNYPHADGMRTGSVVWVIWLATIFWHSTASTATTTITAPADTTCTRLDRSLATARTLHQSIESMTVAANAT